MKRLFVTGMARSGTSWLLKVFGSHPEVLCHYEPFNLVHVRKRLAPELRFWDLLPRLRKLAAEGKIEQAAREFSKPLERFEMVRDHRLDREPFFPQPAEPWMMVIKEDFNGLLKVVGEFGQVLFIVRDPRATLNSLWNHTHFGKDYGARSVAERWVMNLKEAANLAAKRPDEFQVVRYEDLTRDPVKKAQELHEWAGLAPFHPEVKKFMEESVSRHEQDPYGVFKNPQEVEARWKRELGGPIQDLVLKVAGKSKIARGFYPEVLS